MRSGRFLRWWVGAVLLTAVVVGAFAAVGHLFDSQDGGLEVVLSNGGCLGGSSPVPSAADCSRTEWMYWHWWVWPLGVLLAGLAIGSVVALVAFTTGHDQAESGEEPL